MSIKITGKDFKKIYDEVGYWVRNHWAGRWIDDFYNDLFPCGVKYHPFANQPIFIDDVIYKTTLDYTILKVAKNIWTFEIKNGSEKTCWGKSLYKVIEIITKAQKNNSKKSFSQNKLDKAYEKEFTKILKDLQKIKIVEMNISKAEEKYLPKQLLNDTIYINLRINETDTKIEKEIKKLFLEKIINSNSIDGVICRFFTNVACKAREFWCNKKTEKDEWAKFVKGADSIYQKIVDVLQNHPEQCKTDFSLILKEDILNLVGNPHKGTLDLSWVICGIEKYGYMRRW